MSARRNRTLLEAQAATDAALEADPARSAADPTLPLFQWHARQTIEASRVAIERGDGFALLAAIRQCATHDLVLPDYVAKAFIAAYDNVLNCRAKSWDAVFGKPYAKGANLKALRKRRNLRLAVWLAVAKIRKSKPEVAIDKRIFERVGAAVDPAIGPTAAGELYYEAVRMLGPAGGRR